MDIIDYESDHDQHDYDEIDGIQKKRRKHLTSSPPRKKSKFNNEIEINVNIK